VGVVSEARRPPANKAPDGSLRSWVMQTLQQALDFQVRTVIADIQPWLAKRSGALLDVGCGDQPYRRFVPSRCRYRGLDWNSARSAFSMSEQPDVTYFDGGRFPFPDGEFDSLMHTEVLEHVLEPGEFLNECRRVLKPDGEMLFTVPFQARYHFIPHDYWRFTPSGLTVLLERAGFCDIAVSPRGTDVTVAAYKGLAVFYRLAVAGIVGLLLCLLLAIIPILLLLIGHISLLWRIGSPDDCIGYSVRAKRSATESGETYREAGGK
jgi:SAM-dependent methyltransferase